MSAMTDLNTTITRLALSHLCTRDTIAVHLRPNGTAPTTLQIMMITRMIDTGRDRVNTMALTVVVFTTTGSRDRDRPLDVTHRGISSCLHVDRPRIGSGRTTTQPVKRLLEMGRGDENE